jgi:hypothetical protein
MPTTQMLLDPAEARLHHQSYLTRLKSLEQSSISLYSRVAHRIGSRAQSRALPL